MKHFPTLNLTYTVTHTYTHAYFIQNIPVYYSIGATQKVLFAQKLRFIISGRGRAVKASD